MIITAKGIVSGQIVPISIAMAITPQQCATNQRPRHVDRSLSERHSSALK
jgi:hypothetical protein